MAGIVVATLTLALLKWVTALFSLDDTADFLLSSVADVLSLSADAADPVTSAPSATSASSASIAVATGAVDRLLLPGDDGGVPAVSSMPAFGTARVAHSKLRQPKHAAASIAAAPPSSRARRTMP